MINISHYPSWRAAIDGREASIDRANAIAMAVRVPAGRHALRLEYREPWREAGALLTLSGLAICAGLLTLPPLFARRRRRSLAEGGLSRA